KIAALTNYRDPKQIVTEKYSRGDIIRNYLSHQQEAIPFLHHLQKNRHHFNGFNLLLGTVDQLFFYNSPCNHIECLSSGTYSVSNATLNTPWPKVTRARQHLQSYIIKNEN